MNILKAITNHIGFKVAKPTKRGKRLIPVYEGGRRKGWIVTERRPIKSVQRLYGN